MTAAGMDSSPAIRGLAGLLDAAAYCHQALAAAGLPVAAAYVADACRSVRRASGAASTVIARERNLGAPDASSSAPLICEDGWDTGVWIAREGDGPLVIRGRIDASGRFAPEPGADVSMPALETADPCWDLLRSNAARDFARNDVGAALLAGALAEFGWIDVRRRIRASVTRGAAALTVRALRGGRPARLLRSPGYLLDRQVRDLLAGLGWRPEQDLDLSDQH